jgi:hypothetical protein
MRNSFGSTLALGLVLLGAVAADAYGEPTPGPPAAVKAVTDCRTIADATERLACYDKTVAAMAEAEDKGDLVSVDRAQRRLLRHQAFGFTLPSLSIFDRGENAEDVNRVEEVLAYASQDAQGRWTLHMQNGAVWRQIDDEFLSGRPRQGAKIVIRRAAIGSFMLSVDGQPGIRVHRDN